MRSAVRGGVGSDLFRCEGEKKKGPTIRLADRPLDSRHVLGFCPSECNGEGQHQSWIFNQRFGEFEEKNSASSTIPRFQNENHNWSQ